MNYSKMYSCDWLSFLVYFNVLYLAINAFVIGFGAPW